MTHQETQIRIQRLTGVTDQEYADAVLNAGIEFLTWYIGAGDKAIVEQISYTPAFWNWFANQFDIMDEVFMYKHTCAGPSEGMQKALRSCWYENHRPDKVPGFPAKHIFDQAYEKMMLEVLHGKEANHV